MHRVLHGGWSPGLLSRFFVFFFPSLITSPHHSSFDICCFFAKEFPPFCHKFLCNTMARSLSENFTHCPLMTSKVYLSYDRATSGSGPQVLPIFTTDLDSEASSYWATQNVRVYLASNWSVYPAYLHDLSNESVTYLAGFGVSLCYFVSLSRLRFFAVETGYVWWYRWHE